MSAKQKEDSMAKHTYFNNRSGALEHRYDCPQCKREQFISDTKDKCMWFIALIIVYIVISGKVSLWNFP